jgi:hypothetical protein
MEFEDSVKHVSLFHDEFFISSTMSNENSQALYSYLVGCNEAQREDRHMKCFAYEETSQNVQTISKEEQKQEVAQDPLDQSDFCRINPKNSFTIVNKTLHGFVIGPHNFSEETSMRNFCPTVYFKDEKTGESKPYKLMVYIGHKTMLALLFENDFKF